ncbi:MAG: VOC family protein [Acidobacteria bacterium]|nr:VOC family protein [Acidobacteriota bacterium]
MLGTSPLVAFVLTPDAERAKQFYGGTLGLKFVSEDDFAVVYDAHGTTLRVTKLPGHQPSEHTVIGWEVADIVAAATELKNAGVTLERYPFLEQDELGIWTAPDRTAKVAFFKDPDGNVLSIAQH